MLSRENFSPTTIANCAPPQERGHLCWTFSDLDTTEQGKIEPKIRWVTSFPLDQRDKIPVRKRRKFLEAFVSWIRILSFLLFIFCRYCIINSPQLQEESFSRPVWKRMNSCRSVPTHLSENRSSCYFWFCFLRSCCFCQRCLRL